MADAETPGKFVEHVAAREEEFGLTDLKSRAKKQFEDLLARKIAERVFEGEDFTEQIRAKAEEFGLTNTSSLEDAVKVQLGDLVAREIAERILEGEVTPPPPFVTNTSYLR